jgi:hypothetical protein
LIQQVDINVALPFEREGDGFPIGRPASTQIEAGTRGKHRILAGVEITLVNSRLSVFKGGIK